LGWLASAVPVAFGIDKGRLDIAVVETVDWGWLRNRSTGEKQHKFPVF
jgi:hypothetical protein